MCVNGVCPTFAEHNPCKFSPAALRHLYDISICRQHDSSEVLFHEGFPADFVFILCSGHAKVVTSSPEGRSLILRVANPGDILGLDALLGCAVYCVSAQTLSPCAVKSIPREHFVRFMDAYPHVSQIIAQTLARDFNCAVLTARRLALATSAAGRLAAALLDWAHSNHLSPVRAHNHLPIRLPRHVTHEELGSMSGLSRETVCRLLGQFRREGLLTLTTEHFTLSDPDRLETLYCEETHPTPTRPHLQPSFHSPRPAP